MKKTPEVIRPALIGTHVVARKVEDLIPFDRNSRTHSEAQVAQIAASIIEYGFTNPVLIDEANTIIAGEGRFLAAKKLKLANVPCLMLSGLTAAQKAAYVIADNKLALNSGWDADMLRAEFARLDDLEFDFNLTGFSEVEVLDLGFTVEAELANFVESSGPTTSDVTSTTSAESNPTATATGNPNPDAGTASPPDRDWSGMPEFHQPDARPFRSIIMHFNDQGAVDAFAALIGQNITDKTKYLFHPKQVKLESAGIVYE